MSEPEKQHPGRAVKDGKLRFTSVSQIKIFDPNTDGGCNRRWAFKYIFGKTEPKTAAQTKGTQLGKETEHYLTTGEDVLSPVLRAGKHFLPKPGPDLEVEKPLGDILAAVKLRDDYLRSGDVTHLIDMKRAAGLYVADVPLTGAADCRHRRGEYVDASGVLRKEEHLYKTVEIIDQKTTSRIDDYTSRNGKLYKGWSKTVDEMLDDIQMLGYGVHAGNVYPDITHARLSLVYFQRDNGFTAAKRTGVLEIGEARARFSKTVPIVREMEQVAASATEPNIVPAHIRSCDAFRGCPHVSYCDRPKGEFVDLFQIGKGVKMPSLFGDTSTAAPPAPPPPTVAAPSLFASTAAPAPPIPPAPPQTDVQRQAAIDAARAKFLEAEKRHPLEGLEGYTVGQPCNGKGFYQNGNQQGFIATEPGHQCATCAQLRVHGGINPADAPPLDITKAADPLPPDVIAGLHPQIQAVAQAHAAAVIDRAAAEPGVKEKTSGRCKRGGEKIALTMDMAMAKKLPCPGCGKELKLKPEKEGETWFATLPSHNMPKAEEVQQTQATTVAAPVAPAPPVPPALPISASPPILGTSSTPTFDALEPSRPFVSLSSEEAAPITVAFGISLYVNIAFDKGTAPMSLEPWKDDILRTLEKKYSLEDIRLATQDSEIGYGKWKAAVAVMVKHNLPPAGEYSLYVGSSEISAAFVEALIPYCTKFARGAR